MSKRRITHQQSRRIQQKQLRLQTPDQSSENPSALEGLVITRFGSQALIENDEGKQIRCAIRPEITSLVAGDHILWQPEGTDQGVIVCLKPRHSLLSRMNKSGESKPVAANITQIMITLAPAPIPSWTLLDSYLVIAELNNLNAFIVLNKTDLPNEPIKKQLERIYVPIGYPLLCINKDTILDNEELLSTLNHQVSIFVGQSGVGKSTVISKILPHEASIVTNTISKMQFGRHTTSNSILFHLPSGGNLIDSPGVREFKIGEMSNREITAGYKEIQKYITNCKYRNCTHQNTPHCAVIDAVNRSEISQERYINYCNLIQIHNGQ